MTGIRHIQHHTLLTLLLIWGSVAFPQQREASVWLDTNRILIGEQAHLSLEVRFPAQDSLKWPVLADTLSRQIEIVERSPLDTAFDPQEITTRILGQQLTITSFDSGYFVIKPFQFVVDGDTLETEPLLLEVYTVAVDTSQAIADIKPPLEVEYTFMDWLREHYHWLLTGMGTIILIVLAIFLIIRFTRKKPMEVPKVIQPSLPPHQQALERLEKLRKQKLWQEGKIKEYHSEISEILREYIERRFNVQTMEQTTDEIAMHLRTVRIDETVKEKLIRTLSLADLVKFAKEQPIASENERSMEQAVEFIQGTRPVIQEPKEMPG